MDRTGEYKGYRPRIGIRLLASMAERGRRICRHFRDGWQDLSQRGTLEPGYTAPLLAAVTSGIVLGSWIFDLYRFHRPSSACVALHG